MPRHNAVFRTLRARRAALRLLLVLLFLPAAPAHAQEGSGVEGWQWAAAGGALAGAALLDRTLREELASGGQGELEGLSDVANRLGRPQTFVPVLGAVFLGGKLADDDRLSSAAVHVGAALAAAGAVNGTLKYSVGRRRPPENEDPHLFRPFNPDNTWQSFPSGHTVVAFSLAAAVSEEAGRPWVTALAYGTAGVVGWSRMYEEKHWASDVVAGALVGIAASRATVRWLHRREARGEERARLALTPGGLSVTVPLR